MQHVLRDGTNIMVRYLTKEDLPVITQLQEIVIEDLIDKDRLEPLSEEEFLTILAEDKLMIGVFDQKKLIGFRAFLNPKNDEEGLGKDIGLLESEYPRIVYSEISNVHPDYRGNGLQTFMGKSWINSLDERDFRYILATVAPFNIASLKDKFALGMRIYQLKNKYGGKLRYIFCKDLRTNDNQIIDMVTIEMDDTQKQQHYLSDGYVGVKMIQGKDTWYVEYVKYK
ncbi:hypothetical protein [Oceanobacillus iheyensis HTE831]|uniref:N-acetyltransferase domain-containing protein n=1 Tax=Oceanobacillus iheyensis (strain DSM 14371 / CIP 107618 / JCM 11309 / KCTC 3954 / HTE831) TaxID=221109 RepID=Q8ESQ0_OCEIH|nr:hypothetical protein [Oceanobacillus iheyensis]BAC12527.1 hypothetical protein [Oceanobacillus iheyensis HTE831]